MNQFAHFYDDSYSPLWPLYGGHIQTAVSTLWPVPTPQGEQKKHHVPTVDGDKLLVYSHLQRQDPQQKADLLLLHGMEGSSESNYVLSMAQCALEHGFNVHRMNARGCGDGFAHSQQDYHSGRWRDIESVANYVQTGPEMYFCGVSLGGNMLLKMAGDMGADIPSSWRAFAVISTPLDLKIGAYWLAEKQRFYDRYFLRLLLQRYQRRCAQGSAIYQGLLDEHTPRSILEYDEYVIAKINGFAGAHDYYKRCSCGPGLENIAVPTLILYAVDDPIVQMEQYQMYSDILQQNPYLTTVVTRRGGHVGFLQRRSQLRRRFWAEQKVIEFFRQI